MRNIDFKSGACRVLLAMICVFTLAACQPGADFDFNRLKTYGQTAQDQASTSATDGESSPQKLSTSSSHAKISGAKKAAILLPLSGRNAALGQAMLNAAQLALFDMAAAHFELVPYDTAAAGGAAAAAHAVIRDGVQIILGPVFADDVRAVKPIASAANINVVAFSTDWSLAGGNTFIMGFLPFDQIDRITRFAARKNISSAGLLTDDTDYGRMVSSIFRRASAEHKINLARAVSLSPSDKNITPAVDAFVAPVTGTSAVPFHAALISLGGRTAIDVSVAMNKAGATPSLIRRLGTGLFDDPALWREASLNGAWFAAPDPAGRMRFQKDYTATYGDGAPPRIATLAYDATALAAVLATRGGYTKSALINPNGFAGIDGIFRFRENGMVERGLAVLEISAGGISVIDAAPQSFK